MTAPAPREKRLGTIAFVRNAYGLDLFGPNGGLPLLDYEEMWIDMSGTLTITGGTVSGTPVFENPLSLYNPEVQLTGAPIGDSFVQIPASDLEVFNMIAQSKLPGCPRPTTAAGGLSTSISQLTPITTGDVGTYTFRAIQRLPFAMNDLSNPYVSFFPANRYGQVNVRIKWNTEEFLVAGGSRTKTISSTSAIIFGREYTFDPDFDLMKGLFLNQRLQVKQPALVNAVQSDQDYEITRTAAFLAKIMIKQYTTDANGVETPSDAIIRPTDQLILLLNDVDRKFEQFTWEYWREHNRYWYGFELPVGYVVMDMSPRGDQKVLAKMNMMNFSSIKVRANNGAVASSNLRFTVQKLAASA